MSKNKKTVSAADGGTPKPIQLESSKVHALEPVYVPKLNADQEVLLTMAKDTLAAGKAFAEKFRGMAQFIHDKKLETFQINEVLTIAGWPDSRKSELKTIATADDETFRQFQAKELGFRVTLEKAREQANARKGKKPNKKKRAEKMLEAIYKAHAAAAKANPEVKGHHFYGDNMLFVARLAEGTSETVTSAWRISVKVEPLTK
jgi:hypothetical protein